MGLVMRGADTIYVLTLDGWCARVASFAYGHTPNTWNWWPDLQRVVYWGPAWEDRVGTQEWVLEPLAMIQQLTHPDDQLPEGYPYGGVVNYWYTKLTDRRIYWKDGRIYAQVKDVPWPDKPESGGFPFPFVGAHIAGPGRTNTEVLVADTSWAATVQQGAGGPAACFYDTVAKKITSPVYFFGRPREDMDIPGGSVFYAPEYGVFITWQAEILEGESPPVSRYTLRIWSTEVEATKITPVQVIAGAPKSGSVVTYRTRVTGDQNDPAENELVDWTLTGIGTLLDIQSKTDVNGYATARVQYQLEDEGESVLTARVEC
jgi:hypothetical protein